MSMPTGLPSFQLKALPLSNQHVSKQSNTVILVLHLLSLSPAIVGFFYNVKASRHLLEKNSGSPLVLGTSWTDYWIANLWCLLAGYWSWIITTSMMRRWMYHYEITNAIVRLITLMVIHWSISAFLQNLANPITQWISACSVLLVGNCLKLAFASHPKYSKEKHMASGLQLNFQSTIVRVLVLPLFAVTCCTLWATLSQVGTLEYTSSGLLQQVQLDTTLHYDASSSSYDALEPRPLVLILSSWEESARERRQVLRQSTLQWLPKETYRFVLGKPPSASAQMKRGPSVVQESQMFHDMLIVPASDKTADKSAKVLEAMRWASTAQYDYLIKTEDDVFVRWDSLLSDLKALGKKTEYWRGLVYRNMLPSEGTQSSMAYDYAMPVLPVYTSGALYVISRDVADLVTNLKTHMRTVANDNENIAVWLFGHSVVPVHDPRMQATSVCEQDLLSLRVPHKDIHTMATLYTNAVAGQDMCKELTHTQCAVCYPCHGKSDDWRQYNLECDPIKGITLHKTPGITRMADTTVKDVLAPSRLGENDAWIIPNVLSQRTSVYSEKDWDLIYWVCWTSEPSTFTDRHWRALELIWIHEPRAVVFMISNTLSTTFFKDYIARGYQIHVVHIDKDSLLNWHWYFGPGTHDWLRDWDKWEHEHFFYWHLTDYVRLYLLYSYGGTYMDMDALWLRAPPDASLEFIGSDYSSVGSDREWSLDEKNLYLPQGLMRFKRGWTLFREMAESAFSSYAYDPKCFNCHGPKAITSYVKDHRAVLEAAKFTILPRHILYPASYLEIYKYLLPNPNAEKELEALTSWNIHLFGKMTNALEIQKGSVIDLLFKRLDLGRSMKTWRLVGPSRYVYHVHPTAETLPLQPVPGRLQGLDSVYVQGRVGQVRIELDIAHGELQVGPQPWKDLTANSQQEANQYLNQWVYVPPKDPKAGGGKDQLTVRVVSAEKTQEIKVEISIVSL
ncbi:galactosyltransferase-domain-containing protein [Spinellus fusiger]|nr:galactosyltransferase-domain-containing protein [Spinellus fusiger]